MSKEILCYKLEKISDISEIMLYKNETHLELPFFSSSVYAGIPSEVDSHIARSIDLNTIAIKNPASSFFVRVSGDSMIGAGIYDNDTIIVDRSVEVTDGKIVIAAVDGDITIKKIKKVNGKLFLLPENDNYKPIEIKNETRLKIWGVAVAILRLL